MLSLVSIIITNYNYAQYIEECIKSCIAQTYKYIEVVVVDDCSTDNSIQVLSKYAQDLRVHVITHNKNKGYAAAKNTGLIHSHGDYIVMLDADDKLTPDSVAVRLAEFEKNPKLDLVHGIALRWYGGNDTRGYDPKNYVHAQGRMWNSRVYALCGVYYEQLRSMADKEFVYRLGVHPESPLPKLVKDRKIDTVVAWYRKHDGQMHKVRKYVHPEINKEVKAIFKARIKQLKREGITKANTRFL